jgi:hypothetical protein
MAASDREEAERAAEAECGGTYRLSLDAWKRAAQLEETARLTDAIRAVWRRLTQHEEWAAAKERTGDRNRAALCRQHAWAQASRAFAALGDEPANDPRPRPELKLVAGEHQAYSDTPAEHPMHSGPLGPDPRTDEDLTAVELPVLGGEEVA